MEASWIRYPSVATRSLVFDPAAGRICRVPRDAETLIGIEREAEVRRQAGGLSPRILDAGQGFIVETWVTGGNGSADGPAHYLRRLAQTLYQARGEQVADYLRSLGVDQLPEDLGDLYRTARTHDFEVPVTLTHGDLVPKNMVERVDGSPTLLDWEYAGRRLASYDAWFHRYHAERNASETRRWDRSMEAINAFHAMENVRFDGPPTSLAHAVHILERASLLVGIGCAVPSRLRRDAVLAQRKLASLAGEG
jgi:hypothetical protein